MKIIVAFLVLCFQLQVSASAQSVTLNLENTSLKEVFRQLRKQTGYGFLYKEADLIGTKPVSISLTNKALKEALDKCLINQPLTYSIEKNFVIIKRKKAEETTAVKQPVTTVQGKVTDEKGEPLIGVSISLKGSSIGTRTDINGVFRLKVDKSSSQILVVRYIGYKQKEVKISGENHLEIRLEPENLLLNEVVSIGYATVDRRDVTGSIASVSERALRDIPISSVEQALTGRLAGVQVTTSEGTPDAEVKIRVRGGNSITQDNSPIYIVDGVQMEEGMKGLAIQDIESIDVLKDASSTSIYGARGANGVVIITTKQGVAGKARINYNPIIGVSKLARALQVQSPYEFVMYQDERSRYSTADSLGFVNKYGTDLNIYRDYSAIDWQDEMFGRNAVQNTHNLIITGGNKDTRFNLSYTLNDQNGIMRKSSYRRDLVNLKIDHDVNTKLKIGSMVRYSRDIVNGAGVSSTSSSTYNLLRNTIRYQPLIISDAAIDEFDDQYFEDNGANIFALINPIALNNAKEFIRKNNVLNVTGSLGYRFNKALSFKSVFGFNFSDQSRENFDSERTPEARYNGNMMAMVGITSANRRTINNSNVLTFYKNFNKDHKLTALIGQEIYNVYYENKDIRMRFFPAGITADKALNQIHLGTTVDGYPRNDTYENRIVSFFSRANYTYKNRYLLTTSLRTDGSSKFAPSERWGYFPSASLAWKVSHEKFMQNVRAVTDLKFRASYGLAGNNRIDDYLYMGFFNSGANYYLNNTLVNGYYYTDLANEHLTWERTTSRNIGLDMTLFKGVRFSVDAYNNLTDRLLINVPIPSSSGYRRQFQNVGQTASKGIEIEIGGTPVRTKSITWNTDFNIAFNRNEVKRISNWQTSALFQSGVFSGPPSDYILKEGAPLGLMYGYVNEGFYTVDDFNYDATTKVYTLKPGVADASAILGVNQPGGMKLRDLDGNNIIDTGDQQVIGNANPKFSGGLNNQFRYKNFDLSVFVNFVYGNDVYNASKIEFTNGYRAYNNMLELMNDRWRTVNSDGVKVQWTEGAVVKGESPEVLAALNADAKIWQPGRSASSGFLPASWAIEDGSFLRLNNITFGYTLPENILKRLKIHNLRVYATGTNLALWTNYTGYDPEVDTRRTTPLTPSVDYSAYPRSRSLLFGLNLTL